MTINDLSHLGWQPYFQQQLSLEEWEHGTPARVGNYQRSLMTVLTEAGVQNLPIIPSMPAMTVGDWLLLDGNLQFQRLLDRTSLFSRKAAGTKVATQLIAANIDTVFIVCSLNQDFNLNRIERYLALSHQARVEPVVVLTKADLCDNSAGYVDQVQALNPILMVEAVNALDLDSVTALVPWCGKGNTVALLGSSGVGKSTLVNTLMGHVVGGETMEKAQTTGTIRADDGKGRHTTTGRSLHLLPSGGLLLDTPGMRQLPLTDCGDGIEGAFADITELASRCQFADCQHNNEPGCAVLAALASGELDARRLSNFHKLLREQAFNSATLAEKRVRERKLGKMYRSSQLTHQIKREK